MRRFLRIRLDDKIALIDGDPARTIGDEWDAATPTYRVTARAEWIPAIPWPMHVRVGFHGASYETLVKRTVYRGGRKAKRARRRLRVWDRTLYAGWRFGKVAGWLAIGAMVAASAIVMPYLLGHLKRSAA